MRGHLTRRKIKERYGFQCKTMASHTKFGTADEPNYANPKVQFIKEKLGPFNYNPAPSEDGVKRKTRPLITLENGARYEGEWNEVTNKREGKGH